MKRPREPRPAMAKPPKPEQPKGDMDGWATLGFQVAMLAKATGK